MAAEFYQALDRTFREGFEAQIAKINRLATKAIAVIGNQRRGCDELRPQDIEAFYQEISRNLRTEIEKAADLVNHGLAMPPETSQEMADRLMRV